MRVRAGRDRIGDRRGQRRLDLGPGRRGARVVAVEMDPPLAVELARRIPGLTIVEGDILDLDWPVLMKAHGAPAGPYPCRQPALLNLTPFLFSFSISGTFPQGRLPPPTGSRRTVRRRPGTQGLRPAGILLQIHFEAKILFRRHPIVHPSAQGRIGGARGPQSRRPLVDLTDWAGFRKFLIAAFAQRRKTLSNNLAASGCSAEQIARILSNLNLAKTIRSEQIEIPLWVKRRGKSRRRAFRSRPSS